MIDVAIINNGFTGIILGALLAKDGVAIKVVSSEIPNIVPFYQNDIENGVMSKVVKKLDFETNYTQTNHKLILNMNSFSISLARDIDSFKDNLISLFPKLEKDIEIFISTIKSLGKEWEQVICNEFNFDWKISKNTLKYSNYSYKDFLYKLFPENNNIRDILLAIAPVGDVSLNTMAGYLYTQVFDGCNIENGILGVIEKCIDLIGKDNIIFVDEIGKIEVNNNDSIYNIELEEKEIKSKYIVDTRDRDFFKKNKFNNEELSYLSLEILSEEKLSDLDGATIVWNKSVEPKWNNVFSYTCEINPFIVWNDGIKNGSGENKYRVDILINKNTSLKEQDLIIKNVIKTFKSSVPLEKVTTFTPKDYEKFYGVKDGTGIRWAFTKEQSMQNPFKIEVKPAYYSTEKWGFAWFTAALATYYQLNKKL